MEIEGVVTSLHSIKPGEIWTKNHIRETKETIESFKGDDGKKKLIKIDIIDIRINNIIGSFSIVCFAGSIAFFAHTIFNLKSIKADCGLISFENLFFFVKLILTNKD